MPDLMWLDLQQWPSIEIGLSTLNFLRDEGTHFVVNGNKKWITNGTYADYHVTAVRTGNSGELSFLLVESGTPGFKARKIAIRDSDISGTGML